MGGLLTCLTPDEFLREVGHRLWLGSVVRIGFLAADEIELAATGRTRYVGEGIVIDDLHRRVTMRTADVHHGPHERHPIDQASGH